MRGVKRMHLVCKDRLHVTTLSNTDYPTGYWAIDTAHNPSPLPQIVLLRERLGHVEQRLSRADIAVPPQQSFAGLHFTGIRSSLVPTLPQRQGLYLLGGASQLRSPQDSLPNNGAVEDRNRLVPRAEEVPHGGKQKKTAADDEERRK